MIHRTIDVAWVTLCAYALYIAIDMHSSLGMAWVGLGAIDHIKYRLRP